MSEVEELDNEVEMEAETEVSPVEKLINDVLSQDFSKAGPSFNELMNAKIADALDQEKIAVADQIYNGADAEDEELSSEEEAELDDMSDEEIDDAIDEIDEED